MKGPMDRGLIARIATLILLIALIIGYLVWRGHPAAELPPPGATQATTKPTLPKTPDTAAIVNLRLSRDQSQSRSLEQLEQIAQVAQSTQARQVAGDEATQLTRTMRIEQETDAVLDAHGYFAATLIDSGQADILVAAPRLTLPQVEGIADFVESVTGLAPEAIRIVPQQ